MMAMEHRYDPIDPDGSIILLKLIENVRLVTINSHCTRSFGTGNNPVNFHWTVAETIPIQSVIFDQFIHIDSYSESMMAMEHTDTIPWTRMAQ